MCWIEICMWVCTHARAVTHTCTRQGMLPFPAAFRERIQRRGREVYVVELRVYVEADLSG